MNLRSPRMQFVLLAMALSLSACEEPAVVGPGAASGPAAWPPTPTPPPAAGGTAGAAAAPDGGVAAADGGPDAAAPAYTDDDFVEVDVSNRDPFRSFIRAMTVRTSLAPQRRVIMPNVSVEEMRLIAIVTGVATPYAMMTDRQNVGYVVSRGDFIGRPEVISSGGADSMPVQLNWRVDRIRDNEVVLMREDPTSPDQPPLVRVVTLHPKDESQRGGGLTVVESPRSTGSAGAEGSAGTGAPTSGPPPVVPANQAPVNR